MSIDPLPRLPRHGRSGDPNDAEGLRRSATELRRGVTRLARRLRHERPSGAMSSNKLVVLSHLHRNGTSTPSEIAAAERQQPQSLTRVFAELELAGLISRRRSEVDRREFELTLTAAGHEALRADMAVRDRWLADALEELSPTEVGVLSMAADLLERLAETDGAARPAAGRAKAV